MEHGNIDIDLTRFLKLCCLFTFVCHESPDGKTLWAFREPGTKVSGTFGVWRSVLDLSDLHHILEVVILKTVFEAPQDHPPVPPDISRPGPRGRPRPAPKLQPTCSAGCASHLQKRTFTQQLACRRIRTNSSFPVEN